MYKIIYYCHENGFISDFNLRLNKYKKYSKATNGRNNYKIYNNKVLFKNQEYLLFLLAKM